MLVRCSIEEFNQQLGSSSPAPGGGSVAALSGALGAELVSMVCSLSIGREEFNNYQDLLINSREKAQSLAKSLQERVDRDTEAFNAVMAAFKMPKETDEDKRERREAIQAGFKEAVQSPLSIAMECLEVLRLTEEICGKSNTNALSDLGVAVLEAHTGLEGAVMNVKINLPSIKDEKFVSEKELEVLVLLEEGSVIKSKIYNYVHKNISQ